MKDAAQDFPVPAGDAHGDALASLLVTQSAEPVIELGGGLDLRHASNIMDTSRKF